MRKRRATNPKQHDQHKFVEILIPPKAMESVFAGGRVLVVGVGEEIQELQGALLDRVKEAMGKLTARQREILELYYFSELSQVEVGARLGIDQSCVSKTIWGNIDYTKGGKVYGGAIKKLKRLLGEDEEVKKIMGKIEEAKGQ